MSIEIEKIKIESISLYKANTQLGESSNELEQVDVSYKAESAFNEEYKLVRIKLNIFFNGFGKQKQPLNITGEYGIEFQIYVDNFSEFVEEIKGEKFVDANLGSVLMGIVFSTARGIIFDQTRNALSKGIILPIIDPKTLIVTEGMR